MYCRNLQTQSFVEIFEHKYCENFVTKYCENLEQEILLKSLNAKYRERLRTEALRKPSKREL